MNEIVKLNTRTFGDYALTLWIKYCHRELMIISTEKESEKGKGKTIILSRKGIQQASSTVLWNGK